MNDTCFMCGKEHSFRQCPLFSDTTTYLGHVAPKPFEQEEPKRSSLPPTQFEQLFGQEAEPLLIDVIDAPEQYSPQEQQLAWELISKEKSIGQLDTQDAQVLDSIAEQMIYDTPASKTPTAPLPSNPGIATQAEMEYFEDIDPPLWGKG